MTNPNEWHLDKKIPAALLLMLVIHTMAAIWFASRLNARVESLEGITRNNSLVLERIVRVEVQLDGVKDTINRIDQSITKIVDKEMR